MTANQAKEWLAEMQSASNPGDKICDEIRIAFGRSVAYGYRCDKPNCNCVGGWWEGEEYGKEYKQRDLEKVAYPAA